jgi:FdhD protein
LRIDLKFGKKVEIDKVKSLSGKSRIYDVIPVELLLKIILNDNEILTLSCSPQNLIELAIGFLLNNGYVENYSDIYFIHICKNELKDKKEGPILVSSIIIKTSKIESGKTIDKTRGFNSQDKEFSLKSSNKIIFSSCGNIDDFIFDKKLKKIKSNMRISSVIILNLNLSVLQHQKYKKELGGLHSAALFDKDGNNLCLMEDIGRHNCIDKIAGFMAINKIEFSDKIIFTTGRLSIDVIYKVCRMTVPVIVSNSSITHSAILLAKKVNLTAIGYARSGRFNIYSWPQRII